MVLPQALCPKEECSGRDQARSLKPGLLTHGLLSEQWQPLARVPAACKALRSSLPCNHVTPERPTGPTGSLPATLFPVHTAFLHLSVSSLYVPRTSPPSPDLTRLVRRYGHATQAKQLQHRKESSCFRKKNKKDDSHPSLSLQLGSLPELASTGTAKSDGVAKVALSIAPKLRTRGHNRCQKCTPCMTSLHTALVTCNNYALLLIFELNNDSKKKDKK